MSDVVKAWNGGTVFCGGNDGCKSENIESLDDEYGSIGENYEVFKCLDCGRILRIELPD